MHSGRTHAPRSMTRTGRVIRGAWFAGAATLLAAVSHGVAGGMITPIAVIATAVLTLPLSVALAGRQGSLWRLALAVSCSQFVYHWSFAGLGLATDRSTDQAAAGPHAGHAMLMTSLPPELLEAGAADGLMWGSHAVAAVLTTALLYRGELALRTLARVVFRAVAHALALRPVEVAPSAVRTMPERTSDLRSALVFLSQLSHRGPPSTLRLSH